MDNLLKAPEANCLHNKNILITGASDGIGRVMALACAEYGATVIMMGRSLEKLEAVYDEITGQGWTEPAMIPADFSNTSYQSLTHLSDIIGREFEHLDGLILNASILGERVAIEDYSVDVWNEVMQVNVNSQFYLTQILLPFLKDAPSASIVLTSSGVGKTGRALWGAYSVSKFATEGFMQVLADELKDSAIRVNCVDPGATRTAMRQDAYPSENPEDVKPAAALIPIYVNLMNAKSLATHGQSIDFNGLNAQSSA
ncbi:MAG: YciK family oxidoreductase [Pseudomonadota bacterium]|nr:YciK family oxidoreductase [Pseudomonadota bacterium]